MNIVFKLFFLIFIFFFNYFANKGEINCDLSIIKLIYLKEEEWGRGKFHRFCQNHMINRV